MTTPKTRKRTGAPNVTNPKRFPRADAIRMLADGAPAATVALQFGVHQTTIWKFRHRPDVAAAIAELQSGAVTVASDVLKANGFKASTFLVTLLTCEDAPWAVRANAAVQILDRIGVTAKGALSPAAAVTSALGADDVRDAARALVQMHPELVRALLAEGKTDVE